MPQDSQSLARKQYDPVESYTTVSLLLVGDDKAGATCLLLKYVVDSYSETYIDNVGGCPKLKSCEVNGVTVKHQIWDKTITYSSIEKDNYRRLPGIIMLVFDLSNRESFTNLAYHFNKIAETALGVSIILVGTKSDKKPGQVLRKEVEDYLKTLSSTHNIGGYVETSAKTGANVEQAFTKAAELHLENLTKTKRAIRMQDPAKKTLILALEKYIKRIESQKNASGQINFKYGFWFFKQSREANRMANYFLAKSLLKELIITGDSIEAIFGRVDSCRDEIINDEEINLKKDYTNRGMNSKELKSIIEQAQASSSPEKSNLARKTI